MKGLLLLELRRNLKPFALSLLPLLAFILLKTVLAGGADEQAQLLAVVLLFLGTLAVPLQVMRDRTSGALEYLGSLPVPGTVLAGVRVLATAAYTACSLLVVSPFLVFSDAFRIPGASGATHVRMVLALGIGLLCVATLLIGLLSRYSLGRVFALLFGAVLLGSLLQPVLLPNLEVGDAEALWAELPAYMAVVGGVAMALLVGAAVAGFALASASLQRNGGPASAPARKALDGLRE